MPYLELVLLGCVLLLSLFLLMVMVSAWRKDGTGRMVPQVLVVAFIFIKAVFLTLVFLLDPQGPSYVITVTTVFDLMVLLALSVPLFRRSAGGKDEQE